MTDAPRFSRIQSWVGTYRRSISAKLLSAILLVSSLVSVFTTAAQLGLDYLQDKHALEKILDLVQESYSQSIAQSLWNMNDAQLKTEAAGILRIPGIRRLEISDHQDEILVKEGSLPRGRTLVRVFPLFFEEGERRTRIGQVKVIADLSEILSKLWRKLIVIFLSQLVKSLIVSSLVFLTIRQLLTRHLIAITQYLRKLDFRESGESLELRRKPKDDGNPDELDVLASTVNRMREALLRSYAEIRGLNQSLERRIQERTRQLTDSQAMVTNQQQTLIATAKMSALGEMAGGVAHEINNPLAIIQCAAAQMEELLAADEPIDKGLLSKMASTVVGTTERIARIIRGLRAFSRDGSADPFKSVEAAQLLDETLSFCRERFKNNGIRLSVDVPSQGLPIRCRSIEICQVLLNLLNNSSDAIEKLPEQWIRISAREQGDWIEIRVADSGSGIPAEAQAKIFQPFFTTKEIGKGTGLGLSISLGIVRSHEGDLRIEDQCANTCFVLRLPKAKAVAAA